ncbi:uncharacterized protein MONOS_857 [Monocercomonoides exilis]|uniref:uncharacterized protein n=1 Tax=Monocercomonoides exilis TaxID=2049356 RepID=UPI00355AC853|nr:hypothetical protein MONOS_857 [Monocercomonoides exilis]|eukprot:MONOS_857.1-p1 / transcript=MONOS_857.1 / gene=MONOS_857 / organism=Monocercomonoides_exilis_PA203 / gene_product=unspecified product / transcript_product=unspecified product / location=Mono_scaffold00014:98581-106852(-) / protein_length=2733 / sequence_SO=supercontig / SO=protein_coding / is_pseudo=false
MDQKEAVVHLLIDRALYRHSNPSRAAAAITQFFTAIVPRFFQVSFRASFFDSFAGALVSYNPQLFTFNESSFQQLILSIYANCSPEHLKQGQNSALLRQSPFRWLDKALSSVVENFARDHQGQNSSQEQSQNNSEIGELNSSRHSIDPPVDNLLLCSYEEATFPSAFSTTSSLKELGNLLLRKQPVEEKSSIKVDKTRKEVINVIVLVMVPPQTLADITEIQTVATSQISIATSMKTTFRGGESIDDALLWLRSHMLQMFKEAGQSARRSAESLSQQQRRTITGGGSISRSTISGAREQQAPTWIKLTETLDIDLIWLDIGEGPDSTDTEDVFFSSDPFQWQMSAFPASSSANSAKSTTSSSFLQEGAQSSVYQLQQSLSPLSSDREDTFPTPQTRIRSTATPFLSRSSSPSLPFATPLSVSSAPPLSSTPSLSSVHSVGYPMGLLDPAEQLRERERKMSWIATGSSAPATAIVVAVMESCLGRRFRFIPFGLSVHAAGTVLEEQRKKRLKERAMAELIRTNKHENKGSTRSGNSATEEDNVTTCFDEALLDPEKWQVQEIESAGDSNTSTEEAKSSTSSSEKSIDATLHSYASSLPFETPAPRNSPARLLPSVRQSHITQGSQSLMQRSGLSLSPIRKNGPMQKPILQIDAAISAKAQALLNSLSLKTSLNAQNAVLEPSPSSNSGNTDLPLLSFPVVMNSLDELTDSTAAEEILYFELFGWPNQQQQHNQRGSSNTSDYGFHSQSSSSSSSSSQTAPFQMRSSLLVSHSHKLFQNEKDRMLRGRYLPPSFLLPPYPPPSLLRPRFNMPTHQMKLALSMFLSKVLTDSWKEHPTNGYVTMQLQRLPSSSSSVKAISDVPGNLSSTYSSDDLADPFNPSSPLYPLLIVPPSSTMPSNYIDSSFHYTTDTTKPLYPSSSASSKPNDPQSPFTQHSHIFTSLSAAICSSDGEATVPITPQQQFESVVVISSFSMRKQIDTEDPSDALHSSGKDATQVQSSEQEGRRLGNDKGTMSATPKEMTFSCVVTPLFHNIVSFYPEQIDNVSSASFSSMQRTSSQQNPLSRNPSQLSLGSAGSAQPSSQPLHTSLSLPSQMSTPISNRMSPYYPLHSSGASQSAFSSPSPFLSQTSPINSKQTPLSYDKKSAMYTSSSSSQIKRMALFVFHSFTILGAIPVSYAPLVTVAVCETRPFQNAPYTPNTSKSASSSSSSFTQPTQQTQAAVSSQLGQEIQRNSTEFAGSPAAFAPTQPVNIQSDDAAHTPQNQNIVRLSSNASISQPEQSQLLSNPYLSSPLVSSAAHNMYNLSSQSNSQQQSYLNSSHQSKNTSSHSTLTSSGPPFPVPLFPVFHISPSAPAYVKKIPFITTPFTRSGTVDPLTLNSSLSFATLFSLWSMCLNTSPLTVTLPASSSASSSSSSSQNSAITLKTPQFCCYFGILRGCPGCSALPEWMKKDAERRGVQIHSHSTSTSYGSSDASEQLVSPPGYYKTKQTTSGPFCDFPFILVPSSPATFTLRIISFTALSRLRQILHVYTLREKAKDLQIRGIQSQMTKDTQKAIQNSTINETASNSILSSPKVQNLNNQQQNTQNASLLLSPSNSSSSVRAENETGAQRLLGKLLGRMLSLPKLSTFCLEAIPYLTPEEILYMKPPPISISLSEDEEEVAIANEANKEEAKEKKTLNNKSLNEEQNGQERKEREQKAEEVIEDMEDSAEKEEKLRKRMKVDKQSGESENYSALFSEWKKATLRDTHKESAGDGKSIPDTPLKPAKTTQFQILKAEGSDASEEGNRAGQMKYLSDLLSAQSDGNVKFTAFKSGSNQNASVNKKAEQANQKGGGNASEKISTEMQNNNIDSFIVKDAMLEQKPRPYSPIYEDSTLVFTNHPERAEYGQRDQQTLNEENGQKSHNLPSASENKYSSLSSASSASVQANPKESNEKISNSVGQASNVKATASRLPFSQSPYTFQKIPLQLISTENAETSKLCSSASSADNSIPNCPISDLRTELQKKKHFTENQKAQLKARLSDRFARICLKDAQKYHQFLIKQPQPLIVAQHVTSVMPQTSASASASASSSAADANMLNSSSFSDSSMLSDNSISSLYQSKSQDLGSSGFGKDEQLLHIENAEDEQSSERNEGKFGRNDGTIPGEGVAADIERVNSLQGSLNVSLPQSSPAVSATLTPPFSSSITPPQAPIFSMPAAPSLASTPRFNLTSNPPSLSPPPQLCRDRMLQLQQMPVSSSLMLSPFPFGPSSQQSNMPYHSSWIDPSLTPILSQQNSAVLASSASASSSVTSAQYNQQSAKDTRQKDHTHERLTSDADIELKQQSVDEDGSLSPPQVMQTSLSLFYRSLAPQTLNEETKKKLVVFGGDTLLFAFYSMVSRNKKIDEMNFETALEADFIPPDWGSLVSSFIKCKDIPTASESSDNIQSNAVAFVPPVCMMVDRLFSLAFFLCRTPLTADALSSNLSKVSVASMLSCLESSEQLASSAHSMKQQQASSSSSFCERFLSLLPNPLTSGEVSLILRMFEKELNSHLRKAPSIAQQLGASTPSLNDAASLFRMCTIDLSFALAAFRSAYLPPSLNWLSMVQSAFRNVAQLSARSAHSTSAESVIAFQKKESSYSEATAFKKHSLLRISYPRKTLTLTTTRLNSLAIFFSSVAFASSISQADSSTDHSAIPSYKLPFYIFNKSLHSRFTDVLPKELNVIASSLESVDPFNEENIDDSSEEDNESEHEQGEKEKKS